MPLQTSLKVINPWEVSLNQPIMKFCKPFLALLALVLPATAKDQPNIVFFFTDDQTTSTLGCYGNPVVKTPVIDGLAKRGTRFEQAFVSHPICWASRASILSGMTARSNRTPGRGDKVKPEALKELYSDLLRRNNYRTGYFGKWHVMAAKKFNRNEHFDEIEVIGRNPFYKKQADGTLRHETDLIVDKGIDFIKRHPKGKPFALNMWFNACHAEDSDRRPGIGQFPWPQSANGLYKDTYINPPRLGDPAIFEKLPDFLKTSITRERFFWRWNTEDKYQENMRAYYRMVTGIDNAIGRFLKALDEAGLSDNTIIVYSADNGYHMANRGLSGKWSHYEESIKVPLIIADPRVPKSKQGQVTKAQALNIDLPATFLEWAGIEIPERYDGRSLVPIVSSKTPADWRTQTFHEHFAVRTRIPAYEGIRTDTHKYVRYIDHDQEFLHDLKNDPDELVNLADDPKSSAILAEMRKRTDARVKELGGPLDPLNQKFTQSTPPHPVAAAAVSPRPGKDGFVRMFNGRNLGGWSGNPELWSVKEGAITGVTDGSLKKNRFLTWKASTIRNFDFRVKVKYSDRTNSGIQYRSKSVPERGLDVVTGYQCDILANPKAPNGMIYDELGDGIIARNGQKIIVDEKGQPWVAGKMPIKVFAPGEWHDYRILVRGNHFQHFIDGHQTVDFINLDIENLTLDGIIGFQVHVGPAMKVQFKDPMIKHLPDKLAFRNAADTKIPKGSVGLRPKGTPAKGWKAPIYGE